VATTVEAPAQRLRTRVRGRVHLPNIGNGLLWFAVFAPLLIIYVATSNVNADAQSPDPVAAALPAWHFAAFHTLHLDTVISSNLWIVVSHHHLVSNRQPGVIFFGIPFYLLLGHGPAFSMFPADVAAGTAAAGAVAFMTLAIREVIGTRAALITAAVMAFGTATWSVSADTLWPHGPDQFFLAMALYLMARNRRFAASCAIALSVFVRAHLAVVALVAGVYLAIKQRSWRPLAVFGGPSVVALAGVLTYDHWAFGSWSLNGGYGGYPTGALLGEVGSRVSLPVNIYGALFSYDRGLVIWCPVALICLVGGRAAWRQAPDWIRIGVLGGVAYLLIQLKMNFFSGGDRFWSYRLTLETLTLLTPLLALGGREVLRRHNLLSRLGIAATIYGIGAQAVGAIWFEPDNLPYSPWWHSKLLQELRQGPVGPRIVMAIVLVGVVAAFVVRRPRPRQSSHASVSSAQLRGELASPMSNSWYAPPTACQEYSAAARD
jgi:hypothetical protein